jgi:RNA-dependent RNA polymerase
VRLVIRSHSRLTALRPPSPALHLDWCKSNHVNKQRAKFPTALPNFGYSTSTSNTANLNSNLHRDTHPPFTDQYSSQAHTESSSSCGTSSGNHKGDSMNRGNRGFQRGSRARGDFRGGRGGNRTYSGSSGSSSGQNNHNRPILRTSYIAASGTPPSDHLSRCPARIDSARLDSPVTPIKEQSSFTMNGHTISETYTPSGNSISSSPRPYGSPTSTQRNYGGNILGYRAATQRPTTRNGEMRWADNQEHTIRILGVPRTCWTKEVYEAMSRYGNVARIEIRAGAPERNALVTFQYVCLD